MRVDLYLFKSGHVKSRSAAKALIESGAVMLDGAMMTKPSLEIDENAEHSVVITQKERFVGRGGLKLEAALEQFNIDVTGLDAIDVGASTGGFTDCLLQRGAKSVIAVDSGEGQLDARLANDERVTNIEKYNARQLSRELVTNGVDIAVMDVSFISQTLILPNLADLIRSGGLAVTLIKPQFEAGRAAIGKGGIVKNKRDRFMSILRVRDSAAASGLYMTDVTVSPITGGDGNVEYLAKFQREAVSLSDNEIKKKTGL